MARDVCVRVLVLWLFVFGHHVMGGGSRYEDVALPFNLDGSSSPVHFETSYPGSGYQDNWKFAGGSDGDSMEGPQVPLRNNGAPQQHQQQKPNIDGILQTEVGMQYLVSAPRSHQSWYTPPLQQHSMSPSDDDRRRDFMSQEEGGLGSGGELTPRLSRWPPNCPMTKCPPPPRCHPPRCCNCPWRLCRRRPRTRPFW